MPNGDHDLPYEIRCGYIDYNRPTSEAGEFHWRCPARFIFDGDADVVSRTLCAHHRHMPQQFPRETWTQGPHAIDRVVRSMDMAQAGNPEKAPEPTALDLDAFARRKRELRAQAEAAGLLPPRDPGEDDA